MYGSLSLLMTDLVRKKNLPMIHQVLIESGMMFTFLNFSVLCMYICVTSTLLEFYIELPRGLNFLFGEQ